MIDEPEPNDSQSDPNQGSDDPLGRDLDPTHASHGDAAPLHDDTRLDLENVDHDGDDDDGFDDDDDDGFDDDTDGDGDDLDDDTDDEHAVQHDDDPDGIALSDDDTDGADGDDEVVDVDDGKDGESDDIQLLTPTDDLPLSSDIADLLVVHDIDVDEFNDTLHRLNLDVEPDGRAFAVALEQHDVVASVEYTDFNRVSQLLAEGAEIKLGNDDILIGLDDVTDEAIVRTGDTERRIRLADLDERWSESTYELLVSQHDDRMIVVMGTDPNEPDGGISG